MIKLFIRVAFAMCCFNMAYADSLKNGSFETASVNPGNRWVGLPTGSKAIAFWTVNSGNIDYVGTYWTASDSFRSVDLNGNTAGSICQSFKTIKDSIYQVQFDLAGNPDGGPTLKRLRISAANSSQEFTFSITGKNKNNMGWQEMAFKFTATDTITTLTFASLVSGAYGPAIDNVRCNRAKPDTCFEVSPLSHDFGEVAIGQTGIRSIKVTNCGGKAIQVHPGKIIGIDSSFFSALRDTFTLQPDSSRNIPVAFAPKEVRSFSAMLLVYSSVDSASVVLSGKGAPADCSNPAIFAIREGKSVLEPITGKIGDTIYVDIRIKCNSNPIDAFGCKLRVDSTNLDFLDMIVPGDLTANFDSVGAKENTRGVITIGGFGTHPIPPQSDGVLIQLGFVVNCLSGDTSAVAITDLIDDIIDLNPLPNTFTCIACRHDGDVNGDGNLTPGDALCIFKIYLHDQKLPSECDVPNFECELIAADANCDGMVTPADALIIFKRYLEGLLPEECPSQSSLAGSRSREKFYALSLQSTLAERELAGKRIQIFELALTVDQASGLEAFGLSLSFPHDKLDFIGVERAALTSTWQYLDGVSDLTGEVTIGGFDDSALRETGSGEILQVLFALKGEAQIDVTEFALFDLKDDFEHAVVTGVVAQREEAAAPKDFELEQNYPNPFNPTTTITYAIPRAEHVTLRIFDLLGKEVATLVNERLPAGRYKAVWDAEGMESGIYFYRLQTVSFTQTRKLTLLQ